MLGDLEMQSRWSVANQGVIIDLSLESLNGIELNRSLDLHGFYYPYLKENNFDLSIQLNKFSTKPLEYLLTSFTSKCEGILDGDLKILGSPENIILQGNIMADIKALKIDYTNTVYSFKDYLRFDEGLISLENVKCYDVNYSSGSINQSLVNFKLTHKNFDHFYMNLSVAPTEAIVLNTTYLDNSLYYGKAVASGKLSITGPFDDLKMDIDVESKKGTNLSISIEDESEVKQFDFVTFRKTQAEIDSINRIKIAESDPFYLDLNLNATLNQDATIQLVMNRETNDIITAKGYGNLKMKINEEGDIKIIGRYNIVNGNYNFVFNGVKLKQFQISEGSYINWDGNLEDAKIDLVAQYRVDAKLSDLLSSIDSSEIYKRQTKVLCLIKIKGELYNPEITFSIEVPNESTNTQELVSRLLNTNDEKGNNNYFMNLNFMSLLMMGKFQPPAVQGFDINTQALSANTATELLANQLGSFIKMFNKDINIDFNWNPGDENTAQEITAIYHNTIFNNRITIDGKVGGGGELKNSQTSRIVGDVDIQYKIKEDGRFLLKAYNRTNYDDPLTNKSKYTQGLGIVYRKDSDTFSGLFIRKKKVNSNLK
jgi:hypothetical protein